MSKQNNEQPSEPSEQSDSSDSDESYESSSVELDDSDLEDEQEAQESLKSYENPKGTEETMGPVMTPDQSNELLKELKNLDPSKRKQMMEMFANFAKNQGNFGNNAFQKVSENGRMTNKERLQEAIRSKSNARKSKSTLLRMQQQLEETKDEQTHGDQNPKNDELMDALTSKFKKTKNQKKRDRKKRAKARAAEADGNTDLAKIAEVESNIESNEVIESV